MLIPSSFSLAFGDVTDFTTNKSLYHEGDTLYVSGNVSSDLDSPEVTIVIFNPGKSTFVTLGSATANSDGSFSATLQVGGPTWTTYGVYPIQVTSEGSSMEKSIEYRAYLTSTSESTLEPSLEPTPESPLFSEPIPEPIPKPSSTFTTLKLQIPNFPSLDKSPQYYLDRYNTETEYKSWFDSQFPFNSIDDVVGYKLTSLGGFPSLDKSPQSYIDRYNTETEYKSWFDSQFPEISIYNILGYEDPVSVPDWIRNNAEWWASGAISDSTFVTGIEFMLENNIIMISNIHSGDVSDGEIPDWIRNNAHWWSQDLISEYEFVNSLKFLIQEGIIIIN
ncbi:MAG: hypothetical protein QQN62_02060 [Nitrosopumilus sp.]